jgi:hypothetical protein
VSVGAFEPGDLDRMRWALHEHGPDQDELVRGSGIPSERALAALGELDRIGEAYSEHGHLHRDEFCQCKNGTGRRPMVHWHTRGRLHDLSDALMNGEV